MGDRHPAPAEATRPLPVLTAEAATVTMTAVAVHAYGTPELAHDGTPPAGLDRPYPIWGSLGGYHVTCDGCGTPYEQPEPLVDDCLIDTLRRSAQAAGWSWHVLGFICPACQEGARADAAAWAALRDGGGGDYERGLTMHVEALRPTDEGAYPSAPTTPVQDMLRLRVQDRATEVRYARAVTA